MKIKYKFEEPIRECFIQSVGRITFIISLSGNTGFICNDTTSEEVILKLYGLYQKKRTKIKCYFTGTLERITSLYTEDMEKLL